MPSSHRLAIQTLLAAVNKRILANETRLLSIAGGPEMSELVDELAELQIRKNELRDALMDGGSE
jgi:hypothetical protein